MTKAAQIIAYVEAHPGVTGREVEILGRIANAETYIRTIWLNDFLGRTKIANICRYYPFGQAPRQEPIITPPGKVFWKSRGYPGIDIDACHRNRK